MRDARRSLVERIGKRRLEEFMHRLVEELEPTLEHFRLELLDRSMDRRRAPAIIHLAEEHGGPKEHHRIEVGPPLTVDSPIEDRPDQIVLGHLPIKALNKCA